MARDCHTCRHPELEAINLMLIAKRPMREISEKYGLSVSAIHRHTKHIPENLSIATRAKEVAAADSVLNKIIELDQRSDTIYRKAVDADDPGLALKALKELREVTSLYAKLTGELQSRTVHNTVVITPEWVSMRSVMLKALEPYPEARMALVAALGGFELVT